MLVQTTEVHVSCPLQRALASSELHPGIPVPNEEPEPDEPIVGGLGLTGVWTEVPIDPEAVSSREPIGRVGRFDGHRSHAAQPQNTWPHRLALLVSVSL